MASVSAHWPGPNSGGPREPQRRVPQWCPLSLIVFSSAALVVPIVLFRRQRAAILASSLASAPRRTQPGSLIAEARIREQPISTTRNHIVSDSAYISPDADAGIAPPDNFNRVLYATKAFGIATLLVSVGATAAVLGMKSWLGLENIEQFSERMRYLFRTKLPILSSGIHRGQPDPSPQPNDDTVPMSLNRVVPSTFSTTDEEQWTLTGAENRLREAFDRGGFSAWAQSAIIELEAESRAEEAKRDLDGENTGNQK